MTEKQKLFCDEYLKDLNGTRAYRAIYKNIKTDNAAGVRANKLLKKKDIAEYGFLDGLQYAFLETESGLVFSQETYESIADVTTLNEVEEYIQTMLQRS